jgi:starch synthase
VIRVLAAVVIPPHMSVSGAARAAELLSAALAEHCHVTLASMMNGGNVPGSVDAIRRVQVESGLPQVMPWSLLPRKFSTLFYRSDLPRIVCEGDFDLVHIHNILPALEMERLARSCRARGLPYVVSTHGFNEVAKGADVYGFSGPKRLAWKLFVEGPVSRVVARASGIFALSPADFDIVRGMGFRGPELSIVPNGVPIPEPADPDKAKEILEGLGIPAERKPGQITGMFLANHTPNKGLPVLLKAFAGVERPYLLIVGGEKRSGIDYEGYVRNCRPGQRIVITGRISDAAVHVLHQRSDLFIFPTLADTFPLVVLEAMAHGVPVIASRVGGIPHQISGDCGVLVEPGDIAGLRSVFEKLADEPEHLSRMGHNARARAMKEFTWCGAARAAVEGYRRILRSNSSRDLAAARPAEGFAGERSATKG